MKKKTARLRLPQEATERTKQGETKKQNEKQKTHIGMNLLTYLQFLASLSGPNSARARTQLTLSLMKQFKSNRLTLH